MVQIDVKTKASKKKVIAVTAVANESYIEDTDKEEAEEDTDANIRPSLVIDNEKGSIR